MTPPDRDGFSPHSDSDPGPGLILACDYNKIRVIKAAACSYGVRPACRMLQRGGDGFGQCLLLAADHAAARLLPDQLQRAVGRDVDRPLPESGRKHSALSGHYPREGLAPRGLCVYTAPVKQAVNVENRQGRVSPGPRSFEKRPQDQPVPPKADINQDRRRQPRGQQHR